MIPWTFPPAVAEAMRLARVSHDAADELGRVAISPLRVGADDGFDDALRAHNVAARAADAAITALSDNHYTLFQTLGGFTL